MPLGAVEVVVEVEVEVVVDVVVVVVVVDVPEPQTVVTLSTVTPGGRSLVSGTPVWTGIANTSGPVGLETETFQTQPEAGAAVGTHANATVVTTDSIPTRSFRLLDTV